MLLYVFIIPFILCCLLLAAISIFSCWSPQNIYFSFSIEFLSRPFRYTANPLTILLDNFLLSHEIKIHKNSVSPALGNAHRERFLFSPQYSRPTAICTRILQQSNTHKDTARLQNQGDDISHQRENVKLKKNERILHPASIHPSSGAVYSPLPSRLCA